MAAFPPPGQPPPERPEIVRRQQIAALTNAKEREALQALVKERDAAVKTNSAADNQTRETKVQAETKNLVDKAYSNMPNAPMVMAC